MAVKLNSSSAERGVALVAVLWLLALLTVIASIATHTARSDALVVSSQKKSRQQYLLAEAGVQLALLNLLARDASERWLGDGEVYPFILHGGLVNISVSDEAGKININLATPALLRRLVQAVDVEPNKIDSLVDAILDWRDRDSLRRLHGAERQDYLSAGLGDIGNRHFNNVDELQLVVGIDLEIFRRLKPLITVTSNHRGVNPLVASKEMLAVISDNSASEIDRYIAFRRQKHRDKNSQLMTLIIGKNFLSRSLGISYTIETTASVYPPSESILQVQVTLRRGGQSRPVDFNRWQLASQ